MSALSHSVNFVRTSQIALFCALCTSCLLVLVSGLSLSVIKEQIQCSASLSPQTVIARQYSNTSANHQVIRCSARISKESFTHPVFDLSFGLTPLTGIFIVRGSKRCSQDNELCWSEFKIPSHALRQLLVPTSEEDNANSVASDTSDGKVTHPAVVEFTCNVADSSGNSSRAVRCTDSGTIRFAKVLKYDERCSSALNADDECGQNMECFASRCACRQGFLPYILTRTETICVEKAALGERCNFTRQCTQMNSNSLCEFDAAVSFKICKCLSGFEEINEVKNRLYCAPITYRSTSVTTSSSTASSREVEVIATNNKDSETHDDVEIFKELPPEDRDARMRNGDDTDLKSLMVKFGKSSQIGLIVFGGVILMAILLVAIIIRLRNHGEMKVRNNSDRSGSNIKPKRVDTKEGPLLGAIHRLSDDEEEVDVRIDDNSDETRDAQLINYDQNSEQTEIDGRSRQDSQTEPYLDAHSNQVTSSRSLDGLTNFNYSAKQSVV